MNNRQMPWVFVVSGDGQLVQGLAAYGLSESLGCTREAEPLTT